MTAAFVTTIKVYCSILVDVVEGVVSQVFPNFLCLLFGFDSHLLDLLV